MNKKKKVKAYLILITVFSLSFLSWNLGKFSIKENFLDEDIQSIYDRDNLMVSGIYNDIIINDSIGSSNNWAWARTQPWCTRGSGTLEDPYIIMDETFISLGSVGPCIQIWNSRKYFIIKNCIIKDSYTVAPGLFLKNVTNGNIIDNEGFNNGVFISLSNSSRNTINNNFGYENNYGIAVVSNSHDNSFTGNTLYNNNFTGIYLQNSYLNDLSGNIVYNNTDQGIGAYTSYNNSISDTIAYNNTNGIYLLDSYNIRIENTKTYNHIHNGIYTFDSHNNSISDTIAYSNSHNGIYLTTSNDNSLFGNILSENIEYGIKISHSNFSRIKGTLAYNNGYSGILVWKGYNNSIYDTIAYDNKNNGIYLVYSYENTIKYTNAYNNSHNGIFLQWSYENFLFRNNLSESVENGIKMSGSQDNIIVENLLFNNDWHGLYLEPLSDSYSDGNFINNNDIYGNNESGIYLKNSCSNNISANFIRDNVDKGVYLDLNSLTNIFYSNVFLRNTIHAIDDGGPNHWNITTIGNYWDNHTDPDISPVDGIVDIPYYIGGSAISIDYLPIAEDGPPEITINMPHSGDLFSNDSPLFNVIVRDNYLHEIWYTLDDGLHNFTFSVNGTISQTAWDLVADGTVSLKFYASDILENIGSAETNVIKDTLPPNIIINSPIEHQNFGETAPSFNIYVSDPHLDTIWYSLDGGTTNYIVTANGTIDQSMWATLVEGLVTITFYANDTLGHIISEEVNVIKIIPDNTFIIIIVVVSIVGGIAIVVVTYLILKKRKAGE